MRTGTVRLPWYGVGFAAIAAAAVAGCSSASSSAPAASGSAAGGPVTASAPAAPSADAMSAVQLAAKSASSASSVTGTMTLQVTSKAGATATPATAGSGDLSLTAGFAERLRPSLLASTTIESLSSSGSTLPGGLSEIVTPTVFYLKWSYLTQQLHLSKPWLAIPVSALSQSSGINLSQVLGSTTGSSNPLAGSQLLAGATSVRQVGAGSVGGVPVTEYAGTLSLDKSLSALSGTTKTQVQQAIAKAGFKTATFTVWIDGSHTVRKAIVTESGSTVTETSTTTITSINQPVTITIPAAGQTTTLPSKDLNSTS